jgi:hypothetical protein
LDLRMEAIETCVWISIAAGKEYAIS